MARVLQLSISLALLFGMTLLVLAISPAELGASSLAIYAGFILLVASVGGSLATTVGLPRLTGFLLVGLVAGPSLLGVLSGEVVDRLQLIDDFALALIAMLAGGELKVEQLKPAARSIAWSTLSVTALVTVGVAVTVLLVRPLIPFLAALPLSASVGLAVLIGIWASNSSPDLTVGVIEEVHAKGPLTDVILGVTIVKDVFVIVLFTLGLSLLAPLIDSTKQFSSAALLTLGWEVAGAIIAGALAGWIFSLYLKGDEDRPPIATFLFAFVLVVTAENFHLELLLMAVSAGFVIENLSPAGDRMIRGIESVSVVIFAFFFAISGASLDLGAVRGFLLAAPIIFFSRVLFTRAGARLGTRLARAHEAIRAKTWRGLISQGGVTLGLLSRLAGEFPELGVDILALGTSVILGNILAGPVILKSALSDEG